MKWLLLLFVLLSAFPVAAQESSQEFYVEALVDNLAPYVGQQFIYTVKFYAVSTPETIFTAPDFEGFWRDGDQLTTSEAEIVNGRQYIVTTTSIVLYPARDGILTIAPTTITIPETVFSNRPRQELTSQSLLVNVLPLPENAPAGFDGAVGRMDTKVEIDKLTASLGEPINLRFTVNGTGNVELLSAPPLPLPDGWRAYPDPSVMTKENRGALLVAEKTFGWRLIPDRAGSVEFPAIVFTYFDPVDVTYRSIASSPFTVTVLPAANGMLELPEFVETARITSTLPLKTISTFTSESVFPVVVWFIPPLIVLLLWGTRTYTVYRKHQMVMNRRKNAIHQARSRLERALKTSGEKTYILIEEAITGYFSDKLNQNTDRPEIIRNVLQQRAIDPDIAGRIVECLIEAEDGRYAPGGIINAENLITRTAETLHLLERVWE